MADLLRAALAAERGTAELETTPRPDCRNCGFIGSGSFATLWASLAGVVAHPRHEQWPDDLGYLDVDLSHVLGLRQVTDAYLAQLARVRGGRLATLDRGLVAAAPDVAELIPG